MMGEHITICHENVTFILKPKRTICKTKHQTFVLHPNQYCWKKQYLRLRSDIQHGKVKDMQEVVSRCNNKIDIMATIYD